MVRLRRGGVLSLISFCLLTGGAAGADWPMWRCDSARTAESSTELPAEPQLRWVRQYPPLTPAYRETRLQFDAGYEPVVVGKTMFVASSRTDRLVALDTDTGRERWEYFAGGPIRLAPAAWRDRLFFGADDGCLYCLDATSGKLLWKFRAVPSGRKVLGNRRMISLWPVRGGPVVHAGKVYFAAGVWSFEGVFVYCLDAHSGKVVWRNDEGSYLYGQHPHDAQAMGGVSPQGYLVVAGDDLVVPCGQAVPARFDLQTGKLKAFELPKPGRQPGGWFAASRAVRRGEVTLDAEINRDLHEDKVYQGPGEPGVRSTITVGGKSFRFADKLAGVSGQMHTMLAADNKLFAVDLDGRIYCFGEATTSVRRYDSNATRRPGAEIASAELPADELVEKVLNSTGSRHGYALLQISSQQPESIERRIATLLRRTKLHIVVTGKETQLAPLRRQFQDLRERLCLVAAGQMPPQWPPYFASLVVADSPSEFSAEQFQVVRPYGGVACFDVSMDEHARLLSVVESLDGEFSLRRSGNLSIVRRGALPGAANYLGGWSSPDERVRAPLGVAWFDDTLGHFKRSPQPWFVDGVMISYPKDWMEKHRTDRRPPYDLLPPIFSDVYTGRLIESSEQLVTNLRFAARDLDAQQPSQYRPPTQRDAWKPKQPIAGERLNPLTGQLEPREIPKSYGCDGGVDYGYLYTMRSGTPAFYDKRLESGVCNISGPRSGCTNSIIPACGVLNVPFFYEGCTCSYPLPVGLSLVSLPPEHEQWSSWGPGSVENIQRVGINFGAPGDRVTPAGTLWLGYPNRGAPSPEVSIEVKPETARYTYEHSVFMRGGEGWPWVAASAVEGVRSVSVRGLRPTRYTVRLTFATAGADQPRRIGVRLDGVRVADGIDLSAARRAGQSAARESGSLAARETDGSAAGQTARWDMGDSSRRAVTLQFERVVSGGELLVELEAEAGDPALSGIELVAEGLQLD